MPSKVPDLHPGHQTITIRFDTANDKGNDMHNNSSRTVDVKVMTVSDAARFIGVGKKVIYQLIEFDEIRAVRSRGRVLIDRSSLEAFHQSGKRP